MMIHECRVGMVVEFGRENGEWTKGEVVKINPTKAKVKTLEGRGAGRGSFAGAVWSVPYSMMRTAGSAPVATANPAELPFPYSPFHEDNLIMKAVVAIYNSLSPENLSWDGEKPRHRVVADRNRLERKLGHLFQALGRPVSESVAYQWSMDSAETAKKA